MLTLEDLKSIPSGSVIATGKITNNPEGVYMTDHRRDDVLRWVAKKGNGYDDWAIYCDWVEKPIEQVLSNGQKVTDKTNIQKLVPCTDEVLELYRQ